jgi:uncharacterized protein (UPF0248 family)
MRKGSLDETLSYAMYKDDPKFYSVTYRDKNTFKNESLTDFMTKEEFSDIPLTRIQEIRKGQRVVWEKGQKQLKVKNSD